jgi:hypothetical protein
MKFTCVDCPPERQHDAVFRVNLKGVPGIFACKEHVRKRADIDPEVEEIADILTGASGGPHER